MTGKTGKFEIPNPKSQTNSKSQKEKSETGPQSFPLRKAAIIGFLHLQFV
jgi:hypothetical protein